MNSVGTFFNTNLTTNVSCDFSVDSTRRWKLPITSTIRIVISEFLLSSLLLSYGIYHAEIVYNGFSPFQTVLWPPVVFISFWLITDPLSTFIHENVIKGYKNVISVLIGLFLTFCIFVTSFCLPWPGLQILSYGLIGGMVTSFILTQIKLESEDDFQSQPKLIEIVSQLSRVLSLLIFPHLIMLLISWLGVFKAQTIHAAILLHIIPVTLIKNNINTTNASLPTLSRYRTIPGLINSQEMIDLSPAAKTTVNEEETSSTSSSSSNEDLTYENSNGKQRKESDFKNEMGVHILPQIPEEDESDEEEVILNRHDFSIKRFSRLSAKLHSLIEKDDEQHKGKSDIILSVTEINKFSNGGKSYLNVDSKISNQGSSTRHKCCFCCSILPCQKYKCGKYQINLLLNLSECVLKKVKFSFKLTEFYPVLLTKTCVMFGTVIYITTIPYFLLENRILEEIDRLKVDAPLVLSVLSTSWFFYLLFQPWVADMPKIKINIIFIAGVTGLVVSLIPAILHLPNNIVILACIIFGFGNGIANLSGEEIYRELIGAFNWSECNNTLSIFTGLLILLIYSIIYSIGTSLYSLYLILAIFYSCIIILWSFLLIIRTVK